MAKISSSPQPPRPREPDKRPRAKAPEVADAGAQEIGANDGVMTLGEARQKEAELRESFNPREGTAPWEDAHSEREEKQERDTLAQRNKRVQEKRAGQKAGAESGGRQGRAQTADAQQQRGTNRLPGAIAGRAGSDGFELGGMQKTSAKPRLDAPLPGGLPIAPAPSPRTASGAMYVLNNAKEPGVYFREDGHDDGQAPEDSEDPELAAAVEECIRLLFGVRGILRVGPGENDRGEPVVVITPHRGFSQSSMRAIPERVHRFKTLVAIPYDLLPLRRDAT